MRCGTVAPLPNYLYSIIHTRLGALSALNNGERALKKWEKGFFFKEKLAVKRDAQCFWSKNIFKNFEV